MTLLELVKQLARETGTVSPSTITTIEGATDEHVQDLIYWIITANWEIEGLREDFRFRIREGVITMEPGRNDYPMAIFLGDEYFKKVVPYKHPYHQSHIQIDNKRQGKIEYVPHPTFTGWFDQRIENTSPSKPTHFAVLPNEEVRFFPTPDKPYELHFNYTRRRLQMTELDICEPAMPLDLRRVIIYWALRHYAFYDEAESRMRTVYEQLDRALLELYNDQLPQIYVDAPQFRGNYGC